MRNAETVLGIIRERGRRGLPLERVYRLMWNQDLFLTAYGRIYRNAGAMTPGATKETADGMSLAKIDTIIEALRHERYRWTPARRVHIPKSNGKTRPLGIPTWSDKLVQEVLRLILEAYYDPQFSDRSHGFRPGRGCHTALREVHRKWNGTVWFIEGDISQYFDSLDHEVLLGILAEQIHDGRFLNLIAGLLKAGYLEEWRFNRTLSGTPQGGIISPILANIYLDRFDKWVETTLIPAHTRGVKRKENPDYYRPLSKATYLRKKGRLEEAHALRKQAQRLPSKLPDDPDYRRLRYVRYADDFLLGYLGTRSEAEDIKRQIGDFLRHTLKLELSEKKTLITHGRTEAARFLGYEVNVLKDDTKRTAGGRRSINGVIGLRVPRDVIRAKCKPYMRNGKPIHRSGRIHDSAYSIVAAYQTEFRGVVEYYRLAFNLRQLDRLKWVMERSLAATLAAKLRITASQVFERYKADIDTQEGRYKGLRVTVERDGKKPLVAQWGGISLKRNIEAELDDNPPKTWISRTELEQRLLADTCERCGSQDRIQVHHVRGLRDLDKPGRSPKPDWVKLMASRRRKTLVLCHPCHMDVEYGRSKWHTPTRNRR